MKNLWIYLNRRFFSLLLKVKTSMVNTRIDNVNWEVNIMTDEEIKIGKQLREKLLNIYQKHPEYKKYKKGFDRYEIFLEKMSEKYNISVSKVRNEIKNSRI